MIIQRKFKASVVRSVREPPTPKVNGAVILSREDAFRHAGAGDWFNFVILRGCGANSTLLTSELPAVFLV